ncbi:MAG: hypothetical protein M1825_004442 [Sarcosagium campestre]|nr:MAG: hypothetical protein M1825_004442 [Sarcosagium campestre]
MGDHLSTLTSLKLRQEVGAYGISDKHRRVSQGINVTPVNVSQAVRMPNAGGAGLVWYEYSVRTAKCPTPVRITKYRSAADTRTNVSLRFADPTPDGATVAARGGPWGGKRQIPRLLRLG